MIEKIKNKIRRMFGKFKNEAQSGIRIGEMLYALKDCKTMVLHSNGRSTSAQMLQSTVWRKVRGDLIINPGMEPNPHVIIVGMSGFGKSTLFKSILMDIKQMGMPAIIFDAHNEHEALARYLGGRVYDSSYYGINLLELNGLSKQQRISEIVSLLKGVYSLGHIQATKLGQCLFYTYRKAESNGPGKAPTIQDLLHELSIFIRNSRSASESNSLLHLREKLTLLNSTAFGKGQISVDGLKDTISSFSLAGLKSPESRIIYIHELLRRIYLSMKQNQKERGLRLFIMVDEAQFLLGSQREAGAIRSMVEEGRKYGVGIVIATHISSNLDRQVLSNASTLISFYPRDPMEINYIASAMSGGDPRAREMVRGRLRRLRQNEAMVISGLMKNPMIVRTRHASELPEMSVQPSESIPDLSAPHDYEKLAETAGPEELDRMIDEGIIAKESVDTGNGKADMVMKKGNKSVEHELCVSRISARLSQVGIKHYILNNSKGPDIVAYIDGSKVAVEYETGRKSIASTARMLDSRKGPFKRIIVFVNSSSFNAYKEGLRSDGIELLDISGLPTFGSPQIGI